MKTQNGYSNNNNGVDHGKCGGGIKIWWRYTHTHRLVVLWWCCQRRYVHGWCDECKTARSCLQYRATNLWLTRWRSFCTSPCCGKTRTTMHEEREVECGIGSEWVGWLDGVNTFTGFEWLCWEVIEEIKVIILFGHSRQSVPCLLIFSAAATKALCECFVGVVDLSCFI